VTEAMKNPREVDMELVEAYLARRALDYLVGFNLSPVLWRKLPGAKSAGRVQSVALRLIVEREMEIEAFRPREYWTVRAELDTPRGQRFEARLCRSTARSSTASTCPTAEAEPRRRRPSPPRPLGRLGRGQARPRATPTPPFMTSTLQQEASRKFGFGARQTMSAAQRLYEAGHITYMRTDGIDMAPEAVMAARDAIKDRYGEAYVPDKPRIYKNKAKNAQEAHECIRPTDMTATPEAGPARGRPAQALRPDLEAHLASQMAAARLERTTVEIASADGQVGLRATGQVVLFDGFLKVYEEGARRRPPPRSDDDDDKRLPQIDRRGRCRREAGVTPEQHFTQPPPRYTEATLVKKMEELGIGRPSTYASIVTTIQDREYVRKDKNRLIPEDKGRLVTIFLLNYFRRYVGYDFTAGTWKKSSTRSPAARGLQGGAGAVLARFLGGDRRDVGAAHLRGAGQDRRGAGARICSRRARMAPIRGSARLRRGRLSPQDRAFGRRLHRLLELSRMPLHPPDRPGEEAHRARPASCWATDDGDEITLRTAASGPTCSAARPTERTKKPPRASCPRAGRPRSIDLAKALTLLSLPREVGPTPRMAR
jgi:DNA topoisomerase-1